MEAQHFAAGAYFFLLLVLVIFIILSVVLIYLLNKELKRSLRREEEGSFYSRAILLAQEEERARLSRELHDTIAQDLRYLSLEMNKIAKTENISEREKLCEDAASLQSDLIRKVRDICDYLVPPDFRFQGLSDALSGLCLNFGKRTGKDCRIDITGEIKPDYPDQEKQLQIFRIVQEALINAEKHAEASEVIVLLRSDPDGSLKIGISDDGKGFNPPRKYDHQYKGEHLGIRGMEERAALLGGVLEIKSEPGEGTLVRLHLEGNDECAVNR